MRRRLPKKRVETKTKDATKKGETVSVTREEGDGEKVTGLLTQCEPVSDKVPSAPGLIWKFWCCKFVFSVKNE